MTKRYWKTVVPNSITHAMQLCKEHAFEKQNFSVQRIADRMTVNPDTLYKYMGTGRMPANLIIAFEQTCEINFVTEYLAHSQGQLLVPVPNGTRAAHKDQLELQIFMTEVSAQITKCHNQQCEPQEAIDAITTLMKDLAFQKKNIAKLSDPQPELSLVAEHE